ncbi:MAG: hypothetical protein AMS21_11815 [Gemmatimonas sp. SG8_38_2]|nr:MAG: hypothetical protein AMS21_11815 [Gemmatimonas sp. SG8_38_2]
MTKLAMRLFTLVWVMVPEPYVGRPGYGGYIGPPPVIYYDEDAALLLPAGTVGRYALSVDETRARVRCEEGPRGTVECAVESKPADEAAGRKGEEPNNVN